MGKVKLLLSERRMIECAIAGVDEDGRFPDGGNPAVKTIAVRNRKHLDALIEYVRNEARAAIGKECLCCISEINGNVVDFGVTIDLNFWDVSKVTDMSGLFRGFDVSPAPEEGWYCKIRLDISEWDVSKVTKMAHMFDGCEHVDFGDLSKWDRSKVTDC